jgi:hypothetical protein
MSHGNPKHNRLIVGQASRLPSKNFHPQAGRLRYIQMQILAIFL